MPRKIIEVPEDPAERNFGQSVAWHFFIRGTRPTIKPTDPTGRLWHPKEARDALGFKSVKTVWNYVDEKSLPSDTVRIEEVLFGESPHYDVERIQLREKLAEARARFYGTSPPAAKLPALISNRIMVTVETDGTDEEAEEAAWQDEERFGEILPPQQEKIGKRHLSRRYHAPIFPVTPRQAAIERRLLAFLAVGALILFAGYGLSRWRTESTAPRTVSVEPKKPLDPNAPKQGKGDKPPENPPETPSPQPPAPQQTPSPPPAPTPQPIPTPQPAPTPEPAPSPQPIPPVQEPPPRQEAPAPAPAPSEPPPSPKKTGVCSNGRVGSFRITCNRILGGGTTLGSTQLAYTVPDIAACQAKCEPVARCVGFTINMADPPGRHACYLFGPTPEGRESEGWVAGER